MNWTSRATLLLLPLAALLGLVAAGCGGSSGGESGGGTVTETGNGDSANGSQEASGASEVDKTSPSYLGGYELCGEGSVDYVAGLFGAEPTAEAVADSVAEQVGGAAGEDSFAQGRQGCLDAFDAGD